MVRIGWAFVLLSGLVFNSDRLSAQSSDLPGAVRVRIFAASSIRVIEITTTRSDTVSIVISGQVVGKILSGEHAVVAIEGNQLRLRWNRGVIPISHGTFISASPIKVTVNEGTTRTYRGQIEVEPDDGRLGTILAINDVRLSDYVAGVLPSEYPFTEYEGVKAQAIVIRTYALLSAERSTTSYDLTDGTYAQVYHGSDRETSVSRRAAAETAGTTLRYDGALIDAVYSSHCGGHTADNDDIWEGGAVAYLRGRKDPYDKEAPVAKWDMAVDAPELLEKLGEHFGSRVESIKIGARGVGSHVKSVEIKLESGTRMISGVAFRGIVNRGFGSQIIRSSVFEIKRQSGDYRFKGRGNGHGVGLCQWGAAAQAKQGRDAEQILKFYYQDVDIMIDQSGVVESTLLTDVEFVEPPSDTVGENKTKEKASPPRKRRVGW